LKSLRKKKKEAKKARIRIRKEVRKVEKVKIRRKINYSCSSSRRRKEEFC